MEIPESIGSAETASARRKIDYCMLMKFLAKGEVQSAQQFCRRYRSRPNLNQLLVDSGRLTQEELDDLISVHQTVGLNQLPLGTFFVYSGCLTTDELRNFLILRKILRLSPPGSERWGQRLVNCALITAEQLGVALADSASTKVTLRQAILNKGWLTEQDLDKIF